MGVGNIKSVGTCRHKRGDWITAKAFWLCADCWARLEARPTLYSLPVGTDTVSGGSIPQVILWQAKRAIPANGLPLNDFLAAMVARLRHRTIPTMNIEDAYDAAIMILSESDEPFGDPDYDWSAAAASDRVDAELEYWDAAYDGN